MMLTAKMNNRQSRTACGYLRYESLAELLFLIGKQKWLSSQLMIFQSDQKDFEKFVCL